ncbi:hypothetical protein ETH_00033745 [Eimeria tenella]|uniref:Uncharacterized protein n=1 Tax=Eimeria tenella TaxID=5802 RepID=U6KV26_EIMTE|nr:hypothetical protein ETH_00033745 [Eimeria tenella]CDJ40214.1 hypothetical protein ETH_00033745 [Eimeria tenella]|eukprot:XP_013230967.1 hypothetical protein ETH_00033745 [Eimeria tenella]
MGGPQGGPPCSRNVAAGALAQQQMGTARAGAGAAAYPPSRSIPAWGPPRGPPPRWWGAPPGAPRHRRVPPSPGAPHWGPPQGVQLSLSPGAPWGPLAKAELMWRLLAVEGLGGPPGGPPWGPPGGPPGGPPPPPATESPRESLLGGPLRHSGKQAAAAKDQDTSAAAAAMAAAAAAATAAAATAAATTAAAVSTYGTDRRSVAGGVMWTLGRSST